MEFLFANLVSNYINKANLEKSDLEWTNSIWNKLKVNIKYASEKEYIDFLVQEIITENNINVQQLLEKIIQPFAWFPKITYKLLNLTLWLFTLNIFQKEMKLYHNINKIVERIIIIFSFIFIFIIAIIGAGAIAITGAGSGNGAIAYAVALTSVFISLKIEVKLSVSTGIFIFVYLITGIFTGAGTLSFILASAGGLAFILVSIFKDVIAIAIVFAIFFALIAAETVFILGLLSLLKNNFIFEGIILCNINILILMSILLILKLEKPLILYLHCCKALDYKYEEMAKIIGKRTAEILNFKKD
jgi:hypothetical protein